MRPALLAVAALLVLPGPASAATVAYEPPSPAYKGNSSPATITVIAKAGEANDIRVEAANPSGPHVIRDLGAPLEGGCERLDAHAVRCPAGLVIVDAGDGDDRVQDATIAFGREGDDVFERVTSIDGGPGADVARDVVRASGGEGDDRLTALPTRSSPAFGSDVLLDGGAGEDTLVDAARDARLLPGPGRDVVEAGAGADVVVDEDPEPGADRLDGGDGPDILSFGTRTEDGRIDLAAQTSSDGDALAGFETAQGGLGDDVLLGSDAADVLRGGAGNDRLAGAGGTDSLVGGSGFDSFDGGAGDDDVESLTTLGSDGAEDFSVGALDARPEPIACGPGDDTISGLDGDLVGRDCEALPHRIRPRPVRVRAGSLDFVVPCRGGTATRGRCRGTVALAPAVPDTSFAPVRRSFGVRRGGRARVRLPANLDLGPDRSAAVTVRYRRRGETIVVRWILPSLRGGATR